MASGVLQRGANVELTREVPGLARVVLGVRWSAGAEAVLAQNLVTATVLCDARGKARSERDFVFFNQLASPDESVRQLEAALGEDDEQVEVELAAVPAGVERVVVVLYVNDSPGGRRTLGQLKGCAIRVLGAAAGAEPAELVRSEDLAAGLRAETALALGELYRHGAEWKFKVLGDGYATGVAGVLSDYGLSA